MPGISNVLTVGGGVAAISTAIALSWRAMRSSWNRARAIGSAFGTARAPETLDAWAISDELSAFCNAFDPIDRQFVGEWVRRHHNPTLEHLRVEGIGR